MTKQEDITSNMGLVYKLAHKYYRHNPEFTFDDLVQVGMMAICEKIHKFDESRGKISTFLTYCIRNEMFKFIVSQKRQYRSLQQQTGVDHPADASKDFNHEEYFSNNSNENVIINMLAEGHDVKTIAETLGLSKKSIYRSIGKLREKIELQK